MYWLARMVYAGEDPHFILRRMLIFASEDVGLAAPQALQVVVAAAESFERTGLPEGRFALAHAALYLATAPKSNSVFAFLRRPRRGGEGERRGGPRPPQGRQPRRRGLRPRGQLPLSPTPTRDHWVAQQYLPDALQGRVFFEPTDQGYESRIQRPGPQPPRAPARRHGGRPGRPPPPRSTSPRPSAAATSGCSASPARSAPSSPAPGERVFQGLQLQQHHLGPRPQRRHRPDDLGGPAPGARRGGCGSLSARQGRRHRPAGGGRPHCPRSSAPPFSRERLDRIGEMLEAGGGGCALRRHHRAQRPGGAGSTRRTSPPPCPPCSPPGAASAWPRPCRAGAQRLQPADRPERASAPISAPASPAAEEAIYADGGNPQVNWGRRRPARAARVPPGSRSTCAWKPSPHSHRVTHAANWDTGSIPAARNTTPSPTTWAGASTMARCGRSERSSRNNWATGWSSGPPPRSSRWRSWHEDGRSGQGIDLCPGTC